MAQNEINQYNESDETNTDITGTTVVQNQMYPYHVDDAFRKLMGALARLIGSASIVAAGTTNLGSLPGEKITVTGNTTITSFGTIKAGTVKFLNFTGTPTLTYNATSLILPTAANIVVAAGDTAVFVSEGSGNWRCVSYQRATGFPVNQPVFAYAGAIFGLTLTNNATDAANDIDIAAGNASSDASSPSSLSLSSALTKRLDAAWAVGNNNGGLDTGVIANTTYHVWLIQRSDTGVVDALFSASATSPTMPTNYDRKRRIGSVIRAAGSLLPFRQKGDEFLLANPQLDIDLTNAPGTTAALYSLSVPTGITVGALVQFAGYGPSSSPTLIVTSPVQNDNGVSDIGGSPFSYVTVANQWGMNGGVVRTNTSGQIRARASITQTRFKITTFGWVDSRGRE